MRVFIWTIFAVLLVFGSMSSCSTTEPTSCCRVCRTGKPCGDSCIARDKQCTKSGGCACSGLTASADLCLESPAT